MVAGHLQQKNGLWYAVLNLKDEEGRRKVKWIGTKLPVSAPREEAEAILNQLRESYPIDCETRKPKGSIFFARYMKEWLEHMEKQVAPTTFHSYQSIVLNGICPYFEKRQIRLCDLKARDIEAYYDHLMKKGLSPNTVIRHHANIRKALHDAFRWELIDVDVANRIVRPRPQKFLADHYSVEEANLLLQAVTGTELELPVLFALVYGMRRSEVLGLRWRAVDFECKSITVEEAVTHTSVAGSYEIFDRSILKRKSSYRSLPLLETVEEKLLEAAARRYPSGPPISVDFVCIRDNGCPWNPNYLSQSFGLFLKKAGLRPIRFHDLRHTCASLQFSHHIPAIEVQHWMGHSTLAITSDIYGHLAFEDKMNSAVALKKI